MKRLKRLAIFLLLPVFLVFFMIFTDPYRLPLVLVVVPFIVLAAIIYVSSGFVLRRLKWSRSRARTIASVATALVLLLGLLQSTRQLSVKDFLILSALLIGLIIYLRRIDV